MYNMMRQIHAPLSRSRYDRIRKRARREKRFFPSSAYIGRPLLTSYIPVRPIRPGPLSLANHLYAIK